MEDRLSAASLPDNRASAPRRQVHTVWEVAQRLRYILEHDTFLGDVWVRGEASNVRLTPGGHLGFTLKDARASLSCMMWRSDAQRLPFDVKDGVALLVRGRVSLFEGRGQVQLYATELEPAGQGALHLAFEQLKAKLDREGLFAAERKRALPAFPRRIGVITSLQGAVVRDVLRTLARRHPMAEVILRSVRVQGEGASLEVAAAIQLFNRHKAADVLIVGRGGGSLEDLWAFNEEPVARAIAASEIPVISAVGHETDVTIADFVADLRAPTPTAAAEMAAPDAAELAEQVARLERLACTCMEAKLAAFDHQVAGLEARSALRRPERLLDQWQQRLESASEGLQRSADDVLDETEQRLDKAAALLDSYSPLRTMQRGYAIVDVDGRLATRVAQLPPGTRATLQLADGKKDVVVA